MSINTGKSIDFSNVDAMKIASTGIRYEAKSDVISIQENVDLRDADFIRDGADLILKWDHGGQITIEDYFSDELTAPTLQGADGQTLSAELVQSFMKSGANYEVAQTHTLSDVSAVGEIAEVTGTTTLTRVDGSVEVAQIGTPVYQGDIVETEADGAVNIAFIDETSFAVSENAKLAIDEYVFDPATESGSTNFSVLKGMFVFTSGLIGREDPDDVMIETPMGSIGIRGTIIAGDTNSGEITVVEGAIVLRDFSGNEITLANQFETAQFKPSEGRIEHRGEMNAIEMVSKFASVSPVSADLFSSIEDTANESIIPEETVHEKSEEQVEDVDAVEEHSEQAVEGEDAHKPAELKDSTLMDEAIPEDGQTHEAHKAHEGDGERMEMLLERAETLIMETGMEEMLMGEDGQLDQGELMEILMNDSEAMEAMKAQRMEARAEIEAEQLAEGTLEGQETSIDEPLFIEPTNIENDGPLVLHVPLGQNSLQAPHDDVVLVGTDGFNVLADFDIANKNVSMKGREGSDQFQIVIDSTGNKETGVLDGGTGVDTLTLISPVGQAGVLDFSKVQALKSVEIIDMGSSPEQETIILTADTIFDSVGAGGTLTIDGDSGDTVMIDFENNPNWTKDTSTPIDGYVEYEYNAGGPTTTLLIGNDVVANSGSNITGII